MYVSGLTVFGSTSRRLCYFCQAFSRVSHQMFSSCPINVRQTLNRLLVSLNDPLSGMGFQQVFGVHVNPFISRREGTKWPKDITGNPRITEKFTPVALCALSLVCRLACLERCYKDIAGSLAWPVANPSSLYAQMHYFWDNQHCWHEQRSLPKPEILLDSVLNLCTSR